MRQYKLKSNHNTKLGKVEYIDQTIYLDHTVYMKTYIVNESTRDRILSYLKQNPCSTLRQIQAAMGFKSHTVALHHIRKLQKRMEVVKNPKRGYIVTGGEELAEMQIEKLASFLMENYGDKFSLMPPEGESAVDFAIRLLSYKSTNANT